MHVRYSPSHHLTWLCVRCGSTHILQKLHGTVLFMGSVQERILSRNHFWVQLQTVSCLGYYVSTKPHITLLHSDVWLPCQWQCNFSFDQLSNTYLIVTLPLPLLPHHHLVLLIISRDLTHRREYLIRVPPFEVSRPWLCGHCQQLCLCH